MSWHAGDFHFFLQIAPFHNKNTTHIRLDMFGGKMEMFILLWSLLQSKNRSWQQNPTGDRRGWGSLQGRLGIPLGCGVRAGPVASPWAGCDELEVTWGTIPYSCQASREALAFSRALQTSPDAPTEARLLVKSLISHVHVGKNAIISSFPKFCSLWGAWLPVWLLHAGSCAHTWLGQAPQSPAEPSRAEPSVLSLLITPYLQEQSWQAGSSGRETSRIYFPLLSVWPGSKTALQ